MGGWGGGIEIELWGLGISTNRKVESFGERGGIRRFAAVQRTLAEFRRSNKWAILSREQSL